MRVLPVGNAIRRSSWIAAAGLLAVTVATLTGQSTFELPAAGCPMAHCDPFMSDSVNTALPVGWSVEPLFQHVAAGAGRGLGCSSNGQVAACAYRGQVVVYEANGHPRFDSGDLVGEWALASAPVVGADGSVIAADHKRIVRFAPNGTVHWNQPLAGGVPLSPVPMQNGVLFIATYGGPVSIHSIADGRFLGSLLVTNADGTVSYDTINTPAVKGNRAYVLMQARDDASTRAQLVAIDVDPANAAAPLRVAWSFPFAGPSGGSPLMLNESNLIIFDADRLEPGGPIAPQLAAVRDDGEDGTLVWRIPLPGLVRASPARDPRGGVWFFSTGAPFLYRLAGWTGQGLQKIDLDALIGEDGVHVPSSAMTIAPDNPSHNTAMVVGAVTDSPPGVSYVAAIDVEQNALLWKVRVADSRAEDFVASQFAVVNDGLAPRVVFPTSRSGAMFVGVR